MEWRPPLERREPAVYRTNSKQNENVCFSSSWNIIFKHRLKIGFRKVFVFFFLLFKGLFVVWFLGDKCDQGLTKDKCPVEPSILPLNWTPTTKSCLNHLAGLVWMCQDQKRLKFFSCLWFLIVRTKDWAGHGKTVQRNRATWRSGSGVDCWYTPSLWESSAYLVVQPVGQRFSTGCDYFSSQGTLGDVWIELWWLQRGRLFLASTVFRPGRLVNILKDSSQSPQPSRVWPQISRGSRVRNPTVEQWFLEPDLG